MATLTMTFTAEVDETDRMATLKAEMTFTAEVDETDPMATLKAEVTFTAEVDETDPMATLKAEMTMREMVDDIRTKLIEAGLKITDAEVRKPRVKRAGEPAAAPVQQAAE